MSDTPQDVFAAEAERAIHMTRDSAPCEKYEPTSRLIELCVYCGWHTAAHDAHANLVDALAHPPRPYSCWKTDAVSLLLCAGAVAWGLVIGWLLR